MNKNISLRFGCHDTLIKEYDNWYLLCRNMEKTIDRELVLLCKQKTDRLSNVSLPSFEELKIISQEIETVFNQQLKYENIEYKIHALHEKIHIHIIPHYKTTVKQYEHLEKIKNVMIHELSCSNFQQKYDTVFTSGCYDLFHSGHLNILQQSKKIAHHLIVGVSTDELIIKEKGRKPVIPFVDRKAIVESIRYVDEVIPQKDKNKQNIVDKYNIDVITVGSDWKGKYPPVTCKMIYFSYTEGISSTSLRAKLLQKVKE